MKRILLVTLFLLLLFAGSVITLYTDYLWFVEVGYTSVFWTALKVKAALFLAGTGIAFLLFWLTVRIARSRGSVSDGSPRASLRALEDNLFEIRQREQIEPLIESLLPVGMVVVPLFAGVLCSSLWEKVLRYANPTTFGKSDPLFGKDIGFYVFQLPLLKALCSGAMVALGVCLIVSVLLYIFDRKIAADQTSVVAAPQVKRHLFTLLGLMLLVKAWGYRLSMYDLLYSSRGVAYGASYTDVHVDLPVLKVLLLLAALCAAFVLVSGFRRGWKLAAAAVGVWAAMALIGGKGLPIIIQKLHVAPNELSVEQPFIKHNIGFTRAAYSLDDVEEKDFTAEEGLTSDVLQQNDLTVQNIRLWDYGPLLTVYKQLQEIRTYYDFNDVDVDRYMLDGRYRQVMLSAREISSDRLPSKLWINEHLSYTHGYGAVVSPVNRIAGDGLPDFLVKNIPPKVTADADVSLKINRPEVYYGEISNDYVFVKTKAREFDYPSGDKNVYSTYAGDGGVPVGGFLRRLAFALRFRSLPVLLNDDITAESRVMFYRRVEERLHRIAPFLTFDPDPYLVVSHGKLYWICDAYTLSDMYPYSQPIPGMGSNYIRNSVKAVVDAYDGAVTFYVADADDPILRTYAKIFPRLFQSLEKMDSDLQMHLRYPQALFEVQARMYAIYHMDDPQVFYNKEDVWEIPAGGVGGASAAAQVLPQPRQPGGPSPMSPSVPAAAPLPQSMEPYYTIMKLPDAPKEEFIQLVPFTPASKDNLRAWMCARNDPPHYGKLLVYNFPKAKLVYGPSQINARIEQEATISQQLTLWRQGGSDVIRGNLLVIPIEQSLLYIQSLYLKAAQGEIPELKRVIAAYGDQIVMETNLERSLTALFGEGAPTPTAAPRTKGTGAQPSLTPQPSSLTSQQDVTREALQHLQKARESYRRDDWAGFGAELKKLEDTLRRSSEEKR